MAAKLEQKIVSAVKKPDGVKAERLRLLEQYGISAELRETPDREYRRDQIRERRAKVDQAGHATKVAERRVKEGFESSKQDLSATI